MNVGFGPFHDLTQFFPVIYLIEFQIFHRSTGDDQTVELLGLHLIKGSIKGIEMGTVRIMPHIAGGLKQFHLNLKGSVGKFAKQLRFGHDFCGHQIKDQQAQGTDVLMYGPIFGHHKDIFALQCRAGRKRVRNFNRHGAPPVNGCLILL